MGDTIVDFVAMNSCLQAADFLIKVEHRKVPLDPEE